MRIHSPTTLHPASILAQLAQPEPMRSAEKGLARQIVLDKRDGQTGKATSVAATIVAIDNGNNALKGALLHANTQALITRRIITAYAPASVLRAGEGITTWQVNESEPFWLGEDALLADKAESLPIGMTEERVPDERYRRFLFACLVELLREAGYEQPGREWQGEHALYLGFGVPNEEVTRAGVKESVQQALRPLFHKPHAVRRVDEQGHATTWQIRLVEVNAYPQTFGSFVTWYYTLDGAAIETDIVKFVALDIGGGQTHTCTVSIEPQPSGKPRLRMEAKLLDEGTIALARALREQLRTQHPGLRLSDVEAQQALVSRTTIIEGRRTRIDELVDESIRSRSQRLLTHLRHLLQEDRTFLMFTGGGAILLEEHLRTLVQARRSRQSFLCGADGDYVSPQALQYQFTHFLHDAHLPRIRFHDLRHSAATLLLAMKVDPKSIQELLGHEDVKTTLGVYGHLLESMRQEVADKMDDFFKRGEKGDDLVE